MSNGPEAPAPSVNLAPLQSLLREAIFSVHELLTRAEIPYFLAYGTALGAEREGDLIPWDFDADLYIHRADVPAVIATLESGFEGTRFDVLKPSANSRYEYLFPRVVLRGVPDTLFRVDLFPLDVAPDTRFMQSLVDKLQQFLNKLYMTNKIDIDLRTHYSPRERVIARGAKYVAALVPAALTARAFSTLVAILARQCSGSTLGNLSGSYGLREFYPVLWFSDTLDAQLHGHEVAVCLDNDAYLSKVYRDYMTRPSATTVAELLEFADTHYLRPLTARGLG